MRCDNRRWRRPWQVTCAVVVAAATAAGCSGKETDDATPIAGGDAGLSAVEVTGEVGAAPTIAINPDFGAAEPEFERVAEGEGEPAAVGQVVRVHYSVVDGVEGASLGGTYDTGPSYVALDPTVTYKTFMAGLTGAKPGSRTVFAQPGAADELAPMDSETEDAGEATAASPEGTNVSAQIVVMDVLAVLPSRAWGEPVEVPPSMPVVTLAETGVPSVQIPETDPPDHLLVQPLLRGTGPEVGVGKTATVMYSGFKWADGQPISTTWESRTPLDVQVGSGQVIQAWDTALVGQPVGSQLLVVAPPATAYGEDGNPEVNVLPTDTLVYVIDILDVR